MSNARTMPNAQQQLRAAIIAIILLWAIGYLTGLGVRDLRQEEGRRATPAKEMLATGNFLVPTLYGQPYLNKPPAYFWLVAATGALSGGVTPWADRFPSALGALAGAILLLYFAPRLIDLPTRFTAAVMLLTSVAMLDKARLGEIDATLAALVFACLLLFWRGQDAPRTRFMSWIWIGIVMGFAVLMKGPGGPLEFYVPVIAYLLWQREWKQLFSPGHLLAVVLMALPTGVWVAAVMATAHLSLKQFIYLWADQLNFNNLPGAPLSVEPGESSFSVSHYVEFMWQSVIMLLPWLLPALLLMRPDVARRNDIQRDLWRFLISSIVALFTVFFLYPSAHPRYMLVIVFPVCILAAMGLNISLWWRSRGAQQLLWAIAKYASLGPAVVGLVGIVLAIVYKDQFVGATLTAIMALLLAAIGWNFTRQAGVQQAPRGLAFAIAMTMLSGIMMTYEVVLAHKAPSDETAKSWAQLRPLIPPTGPVYTMLTYRSGRGNNFFNVQFHISPRLIAADDLSLLPLGQTVTLLLLPQDQPLLEKNGVRVNDLQIIPIKFKLAIAHVTHVTRSAATQPAP